VSGERHTTVLTPAGFRSLGRVQGQSRHHDQRAGAAGSCRADDQQVQRRDAPPTWAKERPFSSGHGSGLPRVMPACLHARSRPGAHSPRRRVGEPRVSRCADAVSTRPLRARRGDHVFSDRSDPRGNWYGSAGSDDLPWGWHSKPRIAHSLLRTWTWFPSFVQPACSDRLGSTTELRETRRVDHYLREATFLGLHSRLSSRMICPQTGHASSGLNKKECRTYSLHADILC